MNENADTTRERPILFSGPMVLAILAIWIRAELWATASAVLTDCQAMGFTFAKPFAFSIVVTGCIPKCREAMWYMRRKDIGTVRHIGPTARRTEKNYVKNLATNGRLRSLCHAGLVESHWK